MFTLATTPISIFNIWRSAITLFKNVCTKIWPLILLAMLFVGMFQPQLGSLQGYTGMTQAEMLNQMQKQPKILLLLLIVSVALLALLWIYVSNVILHRTYIIGKNFDTSPKISFQKVLSKFPKILSATIIILILDIAGLFALIIPGIFIIAMLLFAIPLILFEDCSSFKSIAESCKLVWGNWWRTFIAVLVPIAIVSYVFNILTMFLDKAHLFVVSDILDAIAFGLLFSVSQSLIVVQYNDLKLRKAQKESQHVEIKTP